MDPNNECHFEKDKMLTEENYQEQINSYTKGDWTPLLELIPEIEEAKEYGKMVGGDRKENGILTMPYVIESDLVMRFRKIVYDMPIIISFPWSEWEEGRKMADDGNFDHDEIDVPTKCKLITAIVRNDRFCEGALVSAFESGLILKILKSIKNQIKEEELF